MCRQHKLARATLFLYSLGMFVIGGMMLDDDIAYGGRPLTTEDATVAGAGAVELEVGTEYADTDISKEFSLAMAPIYGITDRLEISGNFPTSFIWPEEEKNTEGFSDISTTAKALIIPERKIMPAALVRTTVKFSNGNERKALGSGDEDVIVTGVATKKIKACTVHAEGGYAFVGDGADDALQDYWVYSLACEYELCERLKVVGEMYGEEGTHVDVAAFNHRRLNPLVGLTFQLTKTVSFDVAWRVGLSPDEKPEHAVVVGISTRLFDVTHKGEVQQ